VIEFDAVLVDEACQVRASPDNLNDAALIQGPRVAGDLVLTAAKYSGKGQTSFVTSEGEPIARLEHVKAEEFGFVRDLQGEDRPLRSVEEFAIFDPLAFQGVS
jgi:hypothetical protein